MPSAAVTMFAAALALAAGDRPSAQPARLVLSQPAPVTPGSPSLPRITAPPTPATTRIDAALAAADARWKGFAADCHSQAERPADTDASRTTDVTMRGPVVFSVVVTESYYCGGAYPDTSTFALAYDLDSGRPINWMALVPASLKAKASLDTGDGSTIGALASPVLHGLYVKSARAGLKDPSWSDCEGVLESPDLAFMAWPDAKTGGLVLQPTGLPHAVAACAEPQTIPTATLRKLGVSARLTDAIDAAHAALKAR